MHLLIKPQPVNLWIPLDIMIPESAEHFIKQVMQYRKKHPCQANEVIYWGEEYQNNHIAEKLMSQPLPAGTLHIIGHGFNPGYIFKNMLLAPGDTPNDYSFYENKYHITVKLSFGRYDQKKIERTIYNPFEYERFHISVYSKRNYKYKRDINVSLRWLNGKFDEWNLPEREDENNRKTRIGDVIGFGEVFKIISSYGNFVSPEDAIKIPQMSEREGIDFLIGKILPSVEAHTRQKYKESHC